MDAETPLSVFEPAKVVRLRPGDVVLFRCPMKLLPAQRARVVEVVGEMFPYHESIILDGGQDIAVLRPEPGLLWRTWRRMFE